MDSRVSSDKGLNPPTPDNAKVVHYYGSQEGGGGPSSPNSRSNAAKSRLHHKADALLLLLRVVTFALSLASLLLMATNSRPLPAQTPPPSPHQRARWLNFDAYRYVFAASAIVCIYSLAEIGLGLWYLYKGRMLMPESFVHWFDFGHDQGFAYLIFSACSAGTAVAHNLREGHILIHGVYGCQQARSFCTQAEISIGFAFGAFLFIALSSLLSGFRLARWLITGPF